MTSCIAISEDLEFPEKELSPYKEPLKKKGGRTSNPYPNFKASSISIFGLDHKIIKFESRKNW